ncbi:hypothetical protein [Sphingobacterium siyangense]|uniref:hypothetical protein n=1 Tax=Sphingobacterium siyangense TaxID=459529 RepID=UPI003DA2D5C8
MSTIINHWYEAYKLIAELLLQKFGDRDNPSRDLYDHLKNTTFADLNRGRLFRDSLTRTNEWGLDPIQIFSTFNYTKIDSYRRIELINALLLELGSDKTVNYISFEGIPTPIITQIAQYRGFRQQNEIWAVFKELLESGISALREYHFIRLNNWRGIKLTSFTMFLFWTNSEEFLPADKNTIEFLKSIDLINYSPKNYSDYIKICQDIKNNTEGNFAKKSIYRDIVLDSYKLFNFEQGAYTLSENSSKLLITNRRGLTKNNDIVKRIKEERSSGFKIIAVRPTKRYSGKRQKHLKNLIEDQLYQLYNSYNIKNNDRTISLDKDKDLNLYNEGELNISISAIVGMNGSGKSTIADFIYLIINKIGFLKNVSSEQELFDEKVHADLFVHLDTIYKISVSDKIEIFKYKYIGDGKYRINITPIESSEFDLEDLFYTIAINYSLYALNSKIIGDWVNPLFHKNDGYQVPLVLNPMRTEGNIDVNKEEWFAKSRLLSNILNPDLIDFEKKEIPEIAPNCTPKSIRLILNKEKINEKLTKFKEQYGSIDKNLVDEVINLLVGESDSVSFAKKETRNYIFLKVNDIANKYLLYKNQYRDLPKWAPNDKSKLHEFIKKLNADNSHVTFKLRQAINFYKFGIYSQNSDSPIIQILEKIDVHKTNEYLRTIDLVPPSFFDIDIAFEDGSTFSNLSSGQKQQILSINTIGYHLYNISSVNSFENHINYSKVNIIFDEVELYFHPEMQKSYINNLLLHVKQLQIDDIRDINILFITHSPFILSDIPSSNILRLKSGKPINTKNTEETFGANIHDLLANDFFLEKGYMGEFANKKIKDTIETINQWKEDKKNNRDKEKEEIYRFIKIIGEPLIKKSLLDLYHEKIGLHESEYSLSEIDEEIERLKLLKERIKK